MTFATQFLGSAFDVDEPTVTQNIQRPFDAGTGAFADRCNRLEFYAAGASVPSAVFQIAVDYKLDWR